MNIHFAGFWITDKSAPSIFDFPIQAISEQFFWLAMDAFPKLSERPESISLGVFCMGLYIEVKCFESTWNQPYLDIEAFEQDHDEIWRAILHQMKIKN